MKKVLALVLALMMALAMLTAATADEAKKPYIGILAPATTHGWVGGVAYYAQQAADSLDIKYEFLTSSDAEEMSSQIEQLISLGVDAIVVWPQFTGVETAAEKALEKGIKISNFDMIINVDAKYAEDMYLLTGDNYGMGYEGGRYIAEKLEGKGKVIALCKPAAGNVNEDRMQGFKDYLEANCPDIELIAEIASDFTREAGLNDMNSALTAYSEIDAVFSLDDETSIGALQAIVESGHTDVKAITGGGGCQEYFNMIADPQYADLGLCSALYSPAMIQDAIRTGIALLNGETPDAVVVIPTTIVSADNVADYLDPENNVY